MSTALVVFFVFVLGLAVGTVVQTLRARRARRPAAHSDPTPAVFNQLFESTPNGIGLWDRELRFVRVNPALASINGLTPEAHIGKSLHEVVPLLADRLEPLFRRVLETGEPLINVELEGETGGHPNERRFWRASYYPVNGTNGAVDGVGVVVVDLTESRRVERAARESEERYRAFIEQTAEAVWRVELEEPVPVTLPVDEQVQRFLSLGYLAECNDAMARMYGFESAAELTGARLNQLLDPADPKNIAYLSEFVRSGYRLVEAESHEHARDGSDRFFLNNLIGIVDRGHITRAWGTQRDITPRIQADQALRQSREQLRIALRAARMATWRWDLHSTERLWDAEPPAPWDEPTEGAASARPFLDQVHPDDRPRVMEALRSAMESDGEYREEYRVVTRDGRVQWVADQGEVIRDDDGRPLYMAGACLDVTRHRLVEDQLRQVQRMDAVGRLAGGMAHETNNQMAVVLGFADFVLGRSDLPDRVREDVEQIRKAAERTAGITSQLLAFSRRQLARPRVLNVNEVIAEFEPVLRRALTPGTELVLRPAPQLGAVKADPGQLEQILLNLALNGCDAMPQGGRLTVETQNVQLSREYIRQKPGVRVAPGPYVRIAVSDTGHGMSRDTLGRIFEPFFTTKPVGQGTGLGLATVYGLVKQADGYIWVYSEQGIGTTFKIYLPIISSGDVAAVETESPVSLGAGETILVVEDEPEVRRMAARSLTEAGYRVLEASGGEQAMDILAAVGDQLRLVLTDVVMPELSGRELAGRMLSLRPDLKLVFMSGYTDEDVIRRGLMERGERFIQKPFSPEALAREVHDALASVMRDTHTGRHSPPVAG